MNNKIDLRAAAKMTGMSTSWWRQQVSRRSVPFYKIGKRVLIDREDVLQLLDRCRVEPRGGQPAADCRVERVAVPDTGDQRTPE
jgi:excisionase family DNA binding protein